MSLNNILMYIVNRYANDNVCLHCLYIFYSSVIQLCTSTQFLTRQGFRRIEIIYKESLDQFVLALQSPSQDTMYIHIFNRLLEKLIKLQNDFGVRVDNRFKFKLWDRFELLIYNWMRCCSG